MNREQMYTRPVDPKTPFMPQLLGIILYFYTHAQINGGFMMKDGFCVRIDVEEALQMLDNIVLGYKYSPQQRHIV